MNKIWVIFSCINDYNQPDHNLVWWNNNRPSIEELTSILGLGKLQDLSDDLVVNVVSIYTGNGARINDIDYSLEEISPGKVK